MEAVKQRQRGRSLLPSYLGGGLMDVLLTVEWEGSKLVVRGIPHSMYQFREELFDLIKTFMDVKEEVEYAKDERNS